MLQPEIVNQIVPASPGEAEPEPCIVIRRSGIFVRVLQRDGTNRMQVHI